MFYDAALLLSWEHSLISLENGLPEMVDLTAVPASAHRCGPQHSMARFFDPVATMSGGSVSAVLADTTREQGTLSRYGPIRGILWRPAGHNVFKIARIHGRYL